MKVIAGAGKQAYEYEYKYDIHQSVFNEIETHNRLHS